MSVIQELIDQATQKQLVEWAKDCALLSLQFFEHSDSTITKALEACDLYQEDRMTVYEARQIALALHAYAREQTDIPYIYALRALAHACASIHVRSHAIHAMNYTNKSLKVQKKFKMSVIDTEISMLQNIIAL